MSYSVTTDYRSGMPKTPKNGLPWKLIACHDTEGGTGRLGALGTISFLVTNAATRNASYHELWWYAEPTDEFGVIRIVPKTHCSHSLNPQPPPNGSYQPDPWVVTSLGDGWKDPNQGVYAVSIAGRVADVDRYSANPKFIGHALRRIGELRTEFGTFVGLAEHFRFNPSTRSDWGKLLTPKLGGLTFAALPDTAVPIGEPMLRYKAEGWKVKGSAVGRETPGGKAFISFADGVELTSVGETLDGLHRSVIVTKADVDYEVYISRVELDPLVPGGDAAFNSAVKGLLLSREAPAGPDCTTEVAAAKADTKAKAIAAVEAI